MWGMKIIYFTMRKCHLLDQPILANMANVAGGADWADGTNGANGANGLSILL